MEGDNFNEIHILYSIFVQLEKWHIFDKKSKSPQFF
jgi:hypothetical protein